MVISDRLKYTAISTGRCNTGIVSFGWRFKTQSLSRSFIDAPVGLVEVVGNFRRGDAVTLIGANGEELGRGLAAYASDEATDIIGCRSEQIEPKLGYRGRTVMVHRDDLVLFGSDV